MVDDTTVATVTRPQIHVRDAAKSFSGRIVVDIDDLTLGDHPIEGLIGPNGAGKTTLMRMIMHSTPLDRGTITMTNANGGGDVVISDLPTHWMAPHGLVKSNQVIMDFDKLTILDSMLLSVAASKYEHPHRLFDELQVYDDAVARVHEYMEYFELGDPYRFAGSAGEKKLLDIIRCLLLEPRFLLLDEPTAGLPDDVTEKVMQIIRDLAGGEPFIPGHELLENLIGREGLLLLASERHRVLC